MESLLRWDSIFLSAIEIFFLSLQIIFKLLK